MTTMYDERFANRIAELRAFAHDKGHLDVPADSALGRWCNYLRGRYAQGALEPARVATLDAMPGWRWQPRSPGPRPNEERNQAMRDLRARGASLEDIAAHFGVSKQRVHQVAGDLHPRERRSVEHLLEHPAVPGPVVSARAGMAAGTGS